MFLKLSPFGDDDELQMIVETPRGSSVKLKYEPKLEVFTVARALPLGLTYPFDWGFIPGTEGEDGDPIDALALHDAATFPGVLLPCRALGVVEIRPERKNGAAARRIQPDPHADSARPPWRDGESGGTPPTPLEIEQFFLSATFFTGKDARLKGWRGPKAAEKLIRSQRS